MSIAATHDRPWVVVGPADAPAIVFIHATRYTRAQWYPQLRALAGRFRCIAPDLPGHGLRADETFTPDAAVAAIRQALLAESATGRAVLVGLSLGGYVAMDLADAHPDLVDGLVLAGCSADPVGGHAWPFRLLARAFELAPGPISTPVGAALFHLRHGRKRGGPVVKAGFWDDGGAVALRALVGRRYLARLARLWIPVLVVNGQFDSVFGPQGDRWAATCRKGRHEVIRGAMHLTNLDRPKAFTALVAAFADEVRPVA